MAFKKIKKWKKLIVFTLLFKPYFLGFLNYSSDLWLLLTVCRIQTSVVKNLPANIAATGDVGSISGWERSAGGGIGNLLKYSCLENPTDRGSLLGYSPWGHKESDRMELEHTPTKNTGSSKEISLKKWGRVTMVVTWLLWKLHFVTWVFLLLKCESGLLCLCLRIISRLLTFIFL